MKIQQKKGVVIIQTTDAKVLVGNNLNCKADEADIFIGKNVEVSGDLSNKMLVCHPGEYESHGVMVQAVPQAKNPDILLFSIDAENVNTVFVTDVNKPVHKNVIDQIGVNNVLIINIDKEIDHVRDLVEDIDPNYVIPLSEDAEIQSNIAKKLAIAFPLKDKSLSVTMEDFETLEDEKPLQLLVLE